MNRILTCLAAVLLTAVAMQARTLRFVYIAHDVDTPIELMVQKIEGYYEDLEDEADDEESVQQTVIYLSSGSNPIVADMKSGQRDEENFNRVISELYERNFHDVDTEVDMNRVIELLSENDFLSSAGNLDMSQLKFEFYVTPTFWSMRQNESFIASLFYALGIDKYYDTNSPDYSRSVSFKIFFPSIEDLRKCIGNEGKPFGNKNVNNINNLLSAPDFIGTYQ